jgi:riboflavin kinase/FMN adenylyltransferase
VKFVILQKFDQEFSSLTPEDFYSRVIRDRLHASYIAVGQDFCFGKARSGRASWLKSRASQEKITVHIGDDVYHENHRISSTQIRDSLKNLGDVETAAKLLGRPYMLEGYIEKGDQLGRTWGFPTANLGRLEQLVPLEGVYAGWVWLGGTDGANSPPIMSLPKDRLPAVFSIGTRPSLNLDNPPLRVEAHLLNGSYGGDRLYGLKAGYYLTHRIRANLKFENLDSLKSQIRLDADIARNILSAPLTN